MNDIDLIPLSCYICSKFIGYMYETHDSVMNECWNDCCTTTWVCSLECGNKIKNKKD